MVLQYKVHNNNKKEMLSVYVTVRLDWTTGWENKSSPTALKEGTSVIQPL